MTKDEVLSILLGAEGDVSGEEISRQLRVSRAAVNNAVNALRSSGYVIDSSTKKGYRLRAGPDRLCPGELLHRLGRERMERVRVLESVESTNTWLRERAGELSDGTVCAANGQSGGRGRLGRSFYSPMDEGLYLSVLMKPGCGVAETAGLTAMAAVETARAVEAVTGLGPGIRWINDLELHGRKLGGILTELGLEAESGRVQYLVVGVGLHAKERRFPPELAAGSISLWQAGAEGLSRCELAAELIRRLDALRRDFRTKREGYLAAYRERCVTLGRRVQYTLSGESAQALAEDVDEDFALIVSDGEERRTLRSGEITLL